MVRRCKHSNMIKKIGMMLLVVSLVFGTFYGQAYADKDIDDKKDERDKTQEELDEVEASIEELAAEQEGIEEERKGLIHCLYNKGKTTEEISELLDLSLKEVRIILSEQE